MCEYHDVYEETDEELKNIIDDPELIDMVFENVFEDSHHIYKVVKWTNVVILIEWIWSWKTFLDWL